MDFNNISREELIEKIKNLNDAVSKLESEMLLKINENNSQKKEQELFRTLINNIPDILYYKDTNGRFIKLNKSCAKYLGLDNPDDATGKTDFDFFPKEQAERIFREDQHIINTGEPVIDRVEKHILPDSSLTWKTVIKIPVFDQSGKIIGIFGILHDITTVKEMENKPDLDEGFYKIILENALIGFATIDLLGKYRSINKAYRDMLGMELKELLNKNVQSIVYPDDLEIARTNTNRIINGEVEESIFEKRLYHKNGNVITVLSKMWAVHDNQYNPLFLVETVDDITDSKNNEKEILLLANAIKSVKECISITDNHDIILYVNDAFLRTYGFQREEIIGKNINIVRSENNPKEVIERILPDTLKGGWNGELLNKRKNGKEFPIHLSTSIITDDKGNTIALIGISNDITEQKNIQNELEKIHRLESIGNLAGGIAHDFNNLLAGILGNVSLSKIYAGSENRLFEKLNDIEISANKAKELSNQLITFARGGNPRKRILPISSFLKTSVERILQGSNSKASFDIEEDLWLVEYDESQISQAISNIVINAAESMPGGGKIEIKAENLKIGKVNSLSLKEGYYIKLSIKDYGFGITEENLIKIFDPFFSTKFLGRGLGLSTAYSIIKKHNGQIYVESEVGKGSIFTIYLPAYPEKAPELEEESEIEIIQKEPKARILFMDDEKVVRDFVDEFLKYSGYEVELASEGAEAVNIFQKAFNSGNPFKIVILDLTVPKGMGAKETLQKLGEIDPNVKAIIASGYQNDKVISNYRNYGFKGALTKPFKIDIMTELIEKLLSD